MAGNLKLLAGLAVGYVLGARAGRERYERIAEATRRLVTRPEVRDLTGKVRSGLGSGLEKAAGTASDRLQQVRGEDRGPGGHALAAAGPAAGEDHGGMGSQQPEAGQADARGRDGGGSSSEEPGPSGGRRERSRRGR